MSSDKSAFLKFFLAHLFFFAGLVLVACSSSPKSKIPIDLKPITEQTIALNQLWHTKLNTIPNPENITTISQNDNQLAICLDKKTYLINKQSGKIDWQMNQQFEIDFGCILDGNNLYLASNKAVIYSINITSKSINWQTKLTNVLSSPISQDRDFIYIRQGNNQLKQIQKSDGIISWQLNLKQNKFSISYQNPLIINENLLFLSSDDGSLFILNKNNLDHQNLKPIPIAYPTGYSDIDSLSAMRIAFDFDRQMAYVSIFGNSTAKVDLDKQQVLFDKEYASLYRPLILEDKIILILEDSQIIALDNDKGGLIWTNNDLKYRITSDPILFEKYLIVFDLEGYLHLIDPNNGATIGRFATKNKKIQSPALIDNKLKTLYFLNNDGDLYAIKLAN